MKYYFELKNIRYDLRNNQLLNLPETSTTRYSTKDLCFKGSLIQKMVPNKFKNSDKQSLFH